MHDDGEEFAGFVPDGLHGVRHPAVEIDAVPLAEDLLPFAEVDLERAGEDEIEFLPVVFRIVAQLVLPAARRGDDEGLARPFLHADGLMKVGEARAAHERKPLAVTRHRVEREIRRLAADDGRHVQPEMLRKIVVE